MNFFPPDVSLRIDPSADVDAAQQMLPAARQLLFRALNMQQAGVPLVQLFLPGSDGSLISVYLADGIKHVYVQPALRAVVTKKVEEEAFEGEEGIVYLMLSGVVRPGTLVDGAAHEFHPTQVCANVYELEYAYQDMVKLGVPLEGTEADSHSPKPSEYSGAMKRVVQALYGIGKTGATTYSADLGGAGAIVTLNQYRREWLCTHGIFRDVHGVWLIEISKDRGVLKMKLPLFDGTDSDSYLDFLVEIGDSDTASIVTEFGGLPNGETFPENDENSIPPVMALDEAIAAGDVIRLATAKDIAEFYVDSATKFNKLALWGYCCWAFSETGVATEVHNTCFWYSNWSFANIWNYDRADATPHQPTRLELLEYDSDFGLSSVGTLFDRGLRAEHWKVVLASATATLTVVERSLYAGPQKKAINTTLGPVYDYQEMLRVPYGNRLYPGDVWGRPPSVKTWYSFNGRGEDEWKQWYDSDCPVLVFYSGEDLRVVRHCPQKTYSEGFVKTEIRSDPETVFGAGPVIYNSLYTENDASFFRADYSGDTMTAYGSYIPWTSASLSDNMVHTEWTEVWTFSGFVYATPGNGYVFSGASGSTGWGPYGYSGPGGQTDVHGNVAEFSYSYTYSQVANRGWHYEYWTYPGIETYDVTTVGTGIWGPNAETTTESTRTATLAGGPQLARVIGQPLDLRFASAVPRINQDGTDWPPIKERDSDGVLYDIEAQISSDGFNSVEPNVGLINMAYTRRYSTTWRRSGSFYLQGDDQRKTARWGTVYWWTFPHFANDVAPEWELSTGLVVPSFCREAAYLVTWEGGKVTYYSVEDKKFLVPTLPEKLTQKLVAPGLGDGAIDGPVLDPFPQAQWVKMLVAIKMEFGTSVNAGPTQCGIVQDGVYADIIYPTLSDEVLTPPASFLGTANGIPVDDCNAQDTTFVGAV